MKEKDKYTVDDIDFVSAKVIAGGHYFSKGLYRLYLVELLAGMITNPDYSFDDLMAIGDSVSLMLELVQIDFTSTFEIIAVPYRIFQGEQDVITPTKQLTDIVNEVDNENITLEIIPDNKHFLSVDTIQGLVAEFK